MNAKLGQLDVSRETMNRLEVFAALLRKWTTHINLVSPRSLDDLWRRHFVDSAQLHEVAGQGKSWADMGSGGGFPGMVLAILAHESMPDRHMTLIESDRRKAAFLRNAARETGVNCTVLAERVESCPRQQADIVSARALAPLDSLLEFGSRHVRPGGLMVFPKGESWKNEVAKAQERWSFTPRCVTSRTEPGSAILLIEGASRA